MKKGLVTRIGEWLDEDKTSDNNMTRVQKWSKWFPTPGNIIFTLVMVALLILTQRTWASSHQSANTPGPSATTINYQGRLADDAGNPETGTLGMSFAIWDAANGGGIIWGPESHSAVPVTDGLFNVGLGSQTSGGIPTTVWNGDRYLEITVSGETLTPRELIRSVPIAGMALTVPNGSITSNKLQPMLEGVSAPTTVSLSNEQTTVISTTINVTVPSKVWLIATADCSMQNGALIIGNVMVDGNQLPGSILAGEYPHGGTTNTKLRYSVSNNYVFDLEPGSHIVELTGRIAADLGIGAMFGNHTKISYMVVSQ